MNYDLNIQTLKWAYIGIIFTLLALPFAILVNPWYALSVIAPYIVWMILFNKKGVGFVIMCLSLCIPEIVGADMFEDFISSRTVWIYRFSYLLIILFALKGYLKRLIKPKTGFIVFCILILGISLFHGGDEMVSWLYRLLTISVFVYACRNDRMSFDEIFCCLTVVIVICGVYALVEYFFRISPYLFIRETSSIFDDKFYRAAGLHGNSLILTGIVISYFALLLIKLKLTGKTNILLLFYVLLVILTTGSRTGIVAIAAIIIAYLIYMLKTSKILKFLFPALLILFVSYFLADYYFPEYLDQMFGRFEDGSGHRVSGFVSVFNICANNPFGVGFNGVSKAMDVYGKGDLIVGFGTLDNSFLTMIAAYGILSPIVFYIYFKDILGSFLKGRKNPNEKVVVFWMIPWILIGFSFTAIAYLNITLLYFGTMGYLRGFLDESIKLQTINGNYNSYKLQK